MIVDDKFVRLGLLSQFRHSTIIGLRWTCIELECLDVSCEMPNRGWYPAKKILDNKKKILRE